MLVGVGVVSALEVVIRGETNADCLFGFVDGAGYGFDDFQRESSAVLDDGSSVFIVALVNVVV